MHRVQNLLFMLGMAVLLMACSLAGTPPASNDGDSVATAIASTMQALTSAAPAATSAAPTTAPTEAAQPTASQGIPVNYKNVSFVIPAGLASDALPQTIAAMTEQTSGPWDVAPEHIRFSLRNYYVAVKPFSVCQIDIYPADEYANQHTVANVSLQRLKGALGNPSASLTNETLPQVPYFNAASMFAAQVKRIHFANGDGVRMVTQYAQGLVPIANDGTFYHFEGLTADGKYYIVAVLPVQAPFLQNTHDANAAAPSGGVPFPGAESLGTPSVYENYVATVSAKLDSFPEDQFSPSLATLDALMQSFKVAP